MNNRKQHTLKARVTITMLCTVLISLIGVGAFLIWSPQHIKEKGSSYQNSRASSEKLQTRLNDQPRKVNGSSSQAIATCSSMTEQAAKNILQVDQISTRVNDASNTNDLEIRSCTYSHSGNSLTLSSYIAKNDVGRSINSVEFGSGRPTNVQNVTNVVQSAFWNGTLKTLFILKNNSRYSIELTNGTLDQTVDAAKHIMPYL